MKKFTISTDSCVDHFKSYLEKNGIHYIILKRITNGVATEEMYDSAAEYERFYTELKEGALPTTSLLNEYEVKEYFQRILQDCDTDIIHIPLSSGLSGTCENVKKAAAELNQTLIGRQIYVVDSLSATRGMAMLIDRLVELQGSGMPALEAARRIEEIRDRQQVWAMVDDLKHLKRGGRISGFKAAIGTMLNIKPILTINTKGKLAIEQTVKGEKKSIEYLLDKLEQYGARANADFSKQTIYLIHSGAEHLLKSLKETIAARYPGIQMDTGLIGPIIGTHTGEGALGIIFEGAPRLNID